MNRIAGFFGGGGKKDDSDMAMPEKTAMALGADAYTSGHGSNFGAAPGAGGQVSRGPSKAAAASPEMLQRAVLQEQRHARVPIAGPARASARRRRARLRRQKALVQQVISKLTEVSFDTCIAKPDSALSAGERACIHTMVGKYLDTSEFVMGRAAKKQQAQQAQQFG